MTDEDGFTPEPILHPGEFSDPDEYVEEHEKRKEKLQAERARERVMLNVEVSRELRTRLKWAALLNERSNKSIVAEALENWLDDEPKYNLSYGEYNDS